MAHGQKWAFSTGLLAGYCGLAIATAIAVAAGGTGRPGAALAILAVAVLLLAARAKAPTAAGVAVMAWLFYSGFITGRHGDLAWHGMDDLWRLGVLAGSAAIGIGISLLAARLGETRQPGTRHLAPVVSLTEARTARHG
jgi:hypothetical protein